MNLSSNFSYDDIIQDISSTACICVIFGATGDLTARKLIPALYNLTRESKLSKNFVCICFGRREKTNESFRSELLDKLKTFSRFNNISEELWDDFSSRIFYHKSDLDDDNGYLALKQLMENIDNQFHTKGNRLFYYSTPPKLFSDITNRLHTNGLLYDVKTEKTKWSRVIIEKPFGKDLESATDLQNDIGKYLDETQIYRIDHFLGKETVQNLMTFRFANSIFEAFWNNQYIDHIQITVAESIGVESRGSFFEDSGTLRDMVQNHLLQVLSFVAMEPPYSLDAEVIRNEKVKVIKALRPLLNEDIATHTVRGQYLPGVVNGSKVKGYTEEENVNPNSKVETFTALKVFIDNWRWANVPFYLRTGKRLKKRKSEIAIYFKNVPNFMFSSICDSNQCPPNVLCLRIQPNEGIEMKFNCKIPGTNNVVRPVDMNFSYESIFHDAPEAYERLILDCIKGDETLFTRSDEVIASWQWISPILDYWKKEQNSCKPYHAGSWGPDESNDLLHANYVFWKND